MTEVEQGGFAGTLFLSHTRADRPLVEAIRRAIIGLQKGSMNSIDIRCSSDREKGPDGGENWRTWIYRQILSSKTTFVVMSRASLTKPWPMWEAGACSGVALERKSLDAKDQRGPLVVTIVYGLENEECPDPLRAEQLILGQDLEAIKGLLTLVLSRHGASEEELNLANERMKRIIKKYSKRVKKALRDAPSISSEAIVQDWLSRLDVLVAAERWSELRGFRHRLYLAFLRRADGEEPIDIRLHRRLGQYLLHQNYYQDAEQELRLARLAGPRDIYVLSLLAEALMRRALDEQAHTRKDSEKDSELGKLRKSIRDVLARIDEVDDGAFEADPDSAGLKGKYLRRLEEDLKGAIGVYREALRQSPDSYYIADVLAQAQLEAGDRDAARRSYETALKIIARIDDGGIWIRATRATAYLFLGKIGEAETALTELVNESPSPNELRTVRDAIAEIADRKPSPQDERDRLLRIVDGATLEAP